MKARLLLLLAILPGCTIYTVNSKSGSDALPLDLRSSSDVRAPKVGVADVPTTQPGVTGTIVSGWDSVTSLPRRFYEAATPDQLRAAANALYSPDADVRRTAINRISGRNIGKRLPYTDVYREKALRDPDASVRASAVRAINHVRNDESTSALVVALGDTDAQVRREAAHALANLPTPSAEAPLRTMVLKSDEDLDTRIAAIDALRHYKSLDTQRVLVSQLNSTNFALAWQARRSLFLQTGSDYRYDEPAWLNYLASASGK